MFDRLGYGHLGLTRQNLRDQAARLEKSLGNVTENVSSMVGKRRRNECGRSEVVGNETCDNTPIAESETRSIVVYNIDTEKNANLENEADLHSENVRQENPMGPDNSPLSEGAIMLIERSTHLLGSVNTQPGDYAGREIDIRTK